MRNGSCCFLEGVAGFFGKTVCFAVAAILVQSVAHGVEPPKKIDPEASCATADCHEGVGNDPIVHGPVAMDECQICHEPKRDRHNFEDVPPSLDLCMACHDDPVDIEAVVHFPATEDCLICHDPHGSSLPGLLRGDKVQDLCFACHDTELIDGEHKHGPAASGACTICHNPHSSNEERLLREKGNALCAICHADFIEEMTAGTYVHEPVKESCTNCHNPHSGEQPRMLPGTIHELCGKCHEEIVTTATGSTVAHAPAKSENGCIECHTPHGGNNPSLLKDAQVPLCLGCHNDKLESSGKPLQDMKALLATNSDWHSPINENGCTSCHDPHGGENFRMLMEVYPPTFYSGYDPDKYALCFTCHEPSMVRDQYTRTLTGFRHGDLNLHFLHVNKEERGRTCRACHEVHASPNPKHIRDTVPYGEWDLPISFSKTETGGACIPGCHEERSYDREFRP